APENDAAEAERVGTVDREDAVVYHIAYDRTVRAAVAKLQRARADGRATGIGVFTGQSLRSCTHLGQTTEAADHPGKVRAGVVIAGSQRACPQHHTASTGQRADGLNRVTHVKGSSPGYRECGLQGESVIVRGLQG